MFGSRILPGSSCAASALLLAAGSSPCLAADRVDFSRDVRPVLSDKCFFCHGPDEKHREAELRLDVQEEALKVVSPGKSGESELIRRITSTDPDEVMPPPKSNRSLSPDQIALIARWVDDGAVWGEHWAFRKLEKPALPALTDSAGARLAPIDSLVESLLAKQGLDAAPPAPSRNADPPRQPRSDRLAAGAGGGRRISGRPRPGRL